MSRSRCTQHRCFSRVVMIGGIELTNTPLKDSSNLVHHLLVAATPQEIPLGGSAESPSVAIGATASLVGVDHRAAPDSGPRRATWWRRWRQEAQLVDGALGRYGRAASPLPAAAMAEQVDSLFPQRHPAQVLGTRRFSHTGQVPMKTCSLDRTTGRSMTFRWVHPPDRPVPHWRQASKTCSTRWVGVMRWRAKPWGRGFLGPFSLGVCWRPDLDAGHPFGAARFGLSLQRSAAATLTVCCLNDSLQLGNQGQSGMALRIHL